jgi:hypothetical protein
MKAGTARANITPAVGSKTANSEKKILGIRSNIYAKALVLDDGTTKAAIVTADVILLGKKIVSETRDMIEAGTDIPGKNVMFAASHTHSGAAATMRDRWFNREQDKSYGDQLVAKMAGAVIEADSRLAESRIGVGEGVAEMNINRWISTPEGAKWAPNPEGPVDSKVSVLRMDHVDTHGEKPFAALVNYAAHASVSHWGEYISADFPGYLQEVLEKVYGDSFQAQFANGASGDLKIKWLKKGDDDSVDFAYGDGDDGARRYGTALAGEALKVFELIETTECDELSVASKEVRFPLLPLPSADTMAAEMEEKRKKGEDTTWEERILPTIIDGTAPTFITGEMQIIRLGSGITLMAVPGELFAEIGLRMREQLSCEHLFIIGYANGYAGYLPSDASCREDGDTPRYDWHKFFWYPACFAEGVEPAILETALKLEAELS